MSTNLLDTKLEHTFIWTQNYESTEDQKCTEYALLH